MSPMLTLRFLLNLQTYAASCRLVMVYEYITVTLLSCCFVVHLKVLLKNCVDLLLLFWCCYKYIQIKRHNVWFCDRFFLYSPIYIHRSSMCPSCLLPDWLPYSLCVCVCVCVNLSEAHNIVCLNNYCVINIVYHSIETIETQNNNCKEKGSKVK